MKFHEEIYRNSTETEKISMHKIHEEKFKRFERRLFCENLAVTVDGHRFKHFNYVYVEIASKPLLLSVENQIYNEGILRKRLFRRFNKQTQLERPNANKGY